MKRSFVIILFIALLSTPGILYAKEKLTPPQQSPSAVTVEHLVVNIPFGGRAIAVATKSNSSLEAIVASETGGLFKTVDNGNTWTHVDSLPLFVMSDVKYHPLPYPNLVFATGYADGHKPEDTGGIWRSTDSGETWSKPAGSTPTCASRVNAGSIAIGGDYIYVGTDCGLSVGTSQGTVWNHVNRNEGVWSLAADGMGNVFICDRDGMAYGKGTSFGSIIIPMKGCYHQPKNLALSPLESKVLYHVELSGTCSGQGRSPATLYEGVYDPGTNFITWSQAAETVCRPNGAGRLPYVVTNRAPGSDPNKYVVYFSDGYQTYRKTCEKGTSPRCGGLSGWQMIVTAHVDHNDLGFDPFENTPKFLATDGGIQRPADEYSTEWGARWRMAALPTNGYDALQIYDMTGTNMSDHLDLYIGTQDNSFWGSRDGGVTWPDTCGNEGYFLQAPPEGTSHPGWYGWITYHDPGAAGNYYTDPHLVCPATRWIDPLGASAERRLGSPYLIAFNGGSIRTYTQLARPSSGQFELYVRNWPEAWRYVNQTTYEMPARGQLTFANDEVSLIIPYLKSANHTFHGDNNLSLMRFGGFRRDGTLNPALQSVTRMETAFSPFGSVAYYPPGEGAWVWPAVFGVDPLNPNNLMLADLILERVMKSTNGGEDWREDRTLTNYVTENNHWAFVIKADQHRLNHKINAAASLVHVIAYNPWVRNHIVVGTNNRGLFESWDGGEHWASIPNTRLITNSTSIFFKRYSPGETNITFYVSTYGRGVWKVSEPIFSGPYMLDSLTLGDWEELVLDPITNTPIDSRLLYDPTFCPAC